MNYIEIIEDIPPIPHKNNGLPIVESSFINNKLTPISTADGYSNSSTVSASPDNSMNRAMLAATMASTGSNSVHKSIISNVLVHTPPVPLASSNIAMSAQGEVLLNATKPPVNIKVVGVGGAGGNAVTHMIRCGVKNATYITVNTDSQALYKTPADIKIQLGDNGQGAGANPNIARKYAEAARPQLKEALQGADMVFITAGLGKGTGTGASAVIAQVAQELNALTVCVVTKPFASEGVGRAKLADAAADELEIHSDAIIVVLNSKLEDRNPDGLLREWYQAADDVLKNAVATIIEVIQTNGYQNVDFRDVASVIGSNRGRALMGTARASGPNRAKDAAVAVLNCDLLEEENLRTARGVLINITAAESSMRGRETNEVINTILASFADDVTPIHGITFDDNMGEEMQVTLIVSGIGARAKTVINPPTDASRINNASVNYSGRTDFTPNQGSVYFSNPSSVQAPAQSNPNIQPTPALKPTTNHSESYTVKTDKYTEYMPTHSVSTGFNTTAMPYPNHNISNHSNVVNNGVNTIPTLTQEIELMGGQRPVPVHSASTESAHSNIMFNPSLIANSKQESQKIVTAMQASGVPNIEIPTYLRNQQDIDYANFLKNSNK